MLVECPECKGKVSDRAMACPHCGFCLKKPFYLKRVSWLFLLLFFVAVGTFLFVRSVRENENAEFERMKDSWPVEVPLTIVVQDGQNKTKPMTASEWRSMNAKRRPHSVYRLDGAEGGNSLSDEKKQRLRDERLEAMRKSARELGCKSQEDSE